MTVESATSDADWLRHLPPVRGRLAANAPIGHLTWFRVGGPAELLFRPGRGADPSVRQRDVAGSAQTGGRCRNIAVAPIV